MCVLTPAFTLLVHRHSTPTIDPECQMLLLAKDGIYLPTAPRAVQQGVLASGNRADVLINCPEGNFTFKSINDADEESDIRDDAINGTLLHIRADPSPTARPQCDLPVFEVNRPCCDRPTDSNPVGPNNFACG